MGILLYYLVIYGTGFGVCFYTLTGPLGVEPWETPFPTFSSLLWPLMLPIFLVQVVLRALSAEGRVRRELGKIDRQIRLNAAKLELEIQRQKLNDRLDKAIGI